MMKRAKITIMKSYYYYYYYLARQWPIRRQHDMPPTHLNNRLPLIWPHIWDMASPLTVTLN